MALTKVITGVTDLNQAQSTNGLKFPTGSVFAGTPEEGMIRNDQSQSSETSSSTMQFYNGTAWKNFVNKTPIPLGSDNFNTVLYQGNGSTQSVTGTAFTPDLVWVKNRGVATSNNLFDSIRGNQRIVSNSTSAQVDLNPYAPYGLPSFNSNGFNIGDNFNGDYGLNGDPSGTYGSAAGYVAWCWKAGGTAVSNTDGTVTSQVSANVDAGFSIVKYTGTLTSSGNISVGHGLSSPPQLIISKRTDSSSPWRIRPFFLNNNAYDYLEFDSGSLAQINSSDGTMSLPTSTTFDNNWNSGLGGVGDVIAYCFHSVAGYSKIGSYTGNGSTTGPIVTLGFEPAWIMIKRSSSNASGGNWIIKDNKRDTTNPNTQNLYANLSAAEENAYPVDFNSNNFQILESNVDINENGGTYIYMAFAAT